MTELFPIKSTQELDQLLGENVFSRKQLGLIILQGTIENNPNKADWQNDLNTQYYACGCDESAFGFFLGVILGCLWLALAWFQGVSPNLVTIAIAILIPVAGGLIGKATGKLIAHNKLKQTVLSIQAAWSD